MAADVSSMVKSSSGGGNSSEILITRDLLGQFSKDLDLKDLHHIQMSLDLKREMIYPKRCKSTNSPSSSSSSSSIDNKNHKNKTTQLDNSVPIKFLEESSLELKLVPSNEYCQSVCTLDKVKFALKREKNETIIKKRYYSDDDDDKRKNISSSSGMFAAACPGCLMYVMTLKSNPKCPSCNAIVQSPLPLKKPRIDLNYASL